MAQAPTDATPSPDAQDAAAADSTPQAQPDPSDTPSVEGDTSAPPDPAPDATDADAAEAEAEGAEDLDTSLAAPPPPPASPPPAPGIAEVVPIGARVGGRYVVRARIGVGGMSVVYHAQEDAIERDVALKFAAHHGEPDDDDTAQRAQTARLRAEAQALGALPSHPNRVVLYQYGHDAEHDVEYVAMERIAGPSLAEVIDAAAVLDVARVWRWGMQTAAALVDVHAAGLVHRDIKPDNLLVARGLLGVERLKLIDFGIAKAAGRREDDRIWGTLRYMAPEVLLERYEDARSDVYAVGVLLYEALTGHDPLELDRVEALTDVLHAHQHGEPAPMQLRPEVIGGVAGLEEVILRCIARDPEARFADAGALLEALEALGGRAQRRTERPGAAERARVVPVPDADAGPRVEATDLDPSSGRLAARDAAGETRVWDTTRGALLRRFAAPTSASRASASALAPWVRFVPGGAHVLLNGADGRMWRCAVASGQAVALDVGGAPLAVALDAAGELAVVATEGGGLELWSLGQLKRLSRLAFGGEQLRVSALALSPDRRFLVAGTDAGHMHLWRFAARDQSGPLSGASDGGSWPNPTHHQPAGIRGLAVTPMGDAVVAVRAGGVAELWLADTRERVWRLELPVARAPEAVHVTQDGERALVAYRAGALVWVDLTRGIVLDHTTLPDDGDAMSACVRPNGDALACLGHGAQVRCWDAMRVRPLQTLGPFRGRLLDVTVAPDGARALTLSAGGAIDRWDLLTGRHLGRQQTGLDDAKRLDRAPHTGRVLLCSATRGLVALEGAEQDTERLHLPPAPHTVPAPMPGEFVETYTLSPDGRLAALGYRSGETRVYGYREASEPIVLPSHGASTTAVAFSPSGQLLAVADAEGHVRVWDLLTAQIDWEGALSDAPIHFVIFSPSGRLLSVPCGAHIEVWNLDQARRVARLEGHQGPIRTLVHGLDGRLLLSASDDRTARLWDVGQQRAVRVLDDHPSPVTAATLDPEGRLVLTLSGPFLSVWSASSARLLTRSIHRGEDGPDHDRWLTTSPEGHYIAHTPSPPNTAALPQRLRHDDASFDAPALLRALYAPRRIARALIDGADAPETLGATQR